MLPDWKTWTWNSMDDWLLKKSVNGWDNFKLGWPQSSLFSDVNGSLKGARGNDPCIVRNIVRFWIRSLLVYKRCVWSCFRVRRARTNAHRHYIIPCFEGSRRTKHVHVVTIGYARRILSQWRRTFRCLFRQCLWLILYYSVGERAIIYWNSKL